MSAPTAEPTTREEPSCLQVTILNVRSLPPVGSDAGTPPRFRPQECLYCSCEVAGKFQSRIVTLAADSQNVDSGWEAVWDFTSEVPCYQMGDSLTFTISERDEPGTSTSLGDPGKCSATDRILGRVDLNSAALAAFSGPLSPGSGDSESQSAAQAMHRECELPLHDAACGFSAILRIRILAGAPPLHCSQSSVLLARSPSTPAVVVKDADATGFGGSEFADTVANQVAKVINPTFQKLLTEVLTRHTQGLADILVAELRRSEVHVIEKINHISIRKPRAPAAPFKRTFSQGGGRPSKAGCDDAASTASAGSDRSDHKHDYNSERSRHPNSDNESGGAVGNFSQRVSVARDAPKHNKKYAVRELSPHTHGADDEWRNKDSRRSAMGGTQKYSAGDMVGLQTNRILESFGLVSGSPGAGRGRRPSLTEYLTGGGDQSGKRHKDKKSSHNPGRHKSRCNTMDSQDSRSTTANSPKNEANAFSGLCPDGREERMSNKTSGRRERGAGNPTVLGASSIDQDHREGRTSKDGSVHAEAAIRRARSGQSLDADRRSNATAQSQEAYREAIDDAAAEASTDSAAFAQSSTRMSASSIEKLRRARVKIGFVSALTRSVRKDSHDEISEQDFAPHASKASRASKNSKRSHISLHLNDSRHDEHFPLYAGDSRANNPDSAFEVHEPTPDSPQISLPGKVSTSEVPKGVLKKDLSFAEEAVAITNISERDHPFESSHTDHSQLDLDLTGLEPSTPSTPGLKGGFVSVGSIAAGSMHSRSISLGASQSVAGGRMSESHNMKSMRIEHEAILMHKSTSMKADQQHFSASEDAGEDGSFLPTLVMLVSGVNLTEWRAAEVVCCLQLLLSIGNFIVSVKFVIDGVISPYCGAASAVLSAGALLGLVSTRLNPIKEVAWPLERYSLIHMFHQDWITKSKRILYLLLVIWLLALAFQSCLPMVSSQVECRDGISDSTEGPPRWPTTWAAKMFPYIAFAHASWIYMALLYCQFHILACLELMLDSFCRRLFEEQLLDGFVSEWNVLQAMLRRSARTVENCFITVQTSALCALLLSAVGIWQDAARTCGSEWILVFLEQVPILVLGLAALLLFSRGATVTEQCTRVPSLINSMELDDPVDETRQYVVNYIINSDAGFYVWDVRLTSFMALKIAYVMLAALFGLIVQLLKIG